MLLPHKFRFLNTVLFEASQRKVCEACPKMQQTEYAGFIFQYFPPRRTVLSFREGYYPHTVTG